MDGDSDRVSFAELDKANARLMAERQRAAPRSRAGHSAAASAAPQPPQALAYAATESQPNFFSSLFGRFQGGAAGSFGMQSPDAVLRAEVGNDREFRNVKAGYDAVAAAEGTKGRGDDGYNVSVGGRLFNSYADHPNMSASFVNKKGQHLTSTAAGRPQILFRTYQRLRQTYNLPRDFSPAAQTKMFVLLSKEAGAFESLKAGHFSAFAHRANRVWASLPGSPHHQHTVSEAQFIRLCASEGGENADGGGRHARVALDHHRHNGRRRLADKGHSPDYHGMRRETSAAHHGRVPHGVTEAAQAHKPAMPPRHRRNVADISGPMPGLT